MIGAALLAKKAVEKGLQRKPWVKTTLAPGLEGRLRLLREVRPHAVPRQARLQPRRLRLHHLHRQLRPAHPRGQPGRQRQRPRGRLGAVGQPQLRGPDQPGREDELPRVAAAGRRLRAGRLDGRRPVQRPARPGHRRQRRLPEGHLADRRPRSRRSSPSAITSEMFTDDYADVFAGDERWQSLPTPEGKTFAWDEESTYVRKPPYFDGMPDEPEPVADIERRPGAAQARRLGHHRPHLARPVRSRRTRRRASTSPSTASSSGTSTPTARVAATTR